MAKRFPHLGWHHSPEKLQKQTLSLKHYLREVPLSVVLIVPFVLETFTAVGLVGYLSFKNGQQAVNHLALQLSSEISDRVDQHLDNYLALPHQLGDTAVDSLQTGLVEIKDFQKAGRYFWKQLQVHQNVTFLGYYLESGEGVGAQRWPPGHGVTIVEHSLADGKDYTYATDSQGNRQGILDVTEYYAPQDQWYIDAVKAGKPSWSRIYTAAGFEGYVAASAVYPIYSQDHQLLGALSADLLLSDISNFLRHLRTSPNGKVFVIERNGLLIGNSSPEATFNIVNGETQRLTALDSPDAEIRATAQYLKQQFGSFRGIQNQQHLDFLQNGQRQFVQITPWHDEYGLDWLVIVTVPESDFMAQINANTRTTILLCIVALLVSVLLGLLTARWITHSVQRLNRASQAIANGNLNQNVQVKGIQELSLLSQAFNRMAQQLKDSFELLETRVVERTTQLAEAKQAAEEAREAADAANRAKSEFLANMSHELRTPLNAVLGFTQILSRDATLNPEQQENLQIISRSGDHLLSLINDVLDMSKIEAGRTVLHESTFDLYLQLDNVADMLQLKAKAKGLKLSFNCSPDIPQYIRTDERKLHQVLLNLLGNAIKFTQQGHVTLSVCSDSQLNGGDRSICLWFSIEDTGPGIPLHEIDAVFEPFTQTRARHKSQEGAGLGLSISRKFVHLMGGEITIRSQPGLGTIVEFCIQAQCGDASEIEIRQPSQQVIALQPGQLVYRILVVDDRWENRQLMLKLLLPLGFDVREATDGQEAIAVWESWEPHLIWMDIRMPIINGYEASQYIKSHLKGQATIIIALTASIVEEERAVVLAAGCDDFVRKPLREDIFFEKMAQHLGVQYLYQEKPATVENLTMDSSAQPLLTFMPQEWHRDLYQAASELNSHAVYDLINQIPSEHKALANMLREKTDQFDFEQLMDLTQQISLQG